MYRSDAWRMQGTRERTSFFLLLLLSQLGGGGVDEREQALPHEALRHVAGDDVTRSPGAYAGKWGWKGRSERF